MGVLKRAAVLVAMVVVVTEVVGTIRMSTVTMWMVLIRVKVAKQ